MPKPKPPSQDVGLAALPAYDDESGLLNVVIERPKGARNQYKFEPAFGVMTLGGVLPTGWAYPFDFGFVPATLAEDGDPLDALVLMDEPAFPGCLVRVRVLGVIRAHQFADGRTERNDRLVTVAGESRLHADVRELRDLPRGVLDEVDAFFVSFNAARGKRFVVDGRHGAKRAQATVRAAERMHRWGAKEASS
jgi:inorganic pyrophosphatase